MKVSRKIYAVFFALFVSTTTFAASQDGTDNSQDMPMMNQEGGMMMSPEMKQQIKESGATSSEMMKQMMASGQHQNMPMMDHQAMQKMMQMRMQHMVKMEQHLEKIESLLAQLLEVQKSK